MLCQLPARKFSGGLQELGFVFCGECRGLGFEFCLGVVVEFWRSAGASGDGNAYLLRRILAGPRESKSNKLVSN
jgi:hypothetical protein